MAQQFASAELDPCGAGSIGTSEDATNLILEQHWETRTRLGRFGACIDGKGFAYSFVYIYFLGRKP